MRKNKFKSFASRLNKDGDHPEKISFESPEEQAEYDKLDFLWNRCLPEETGEPDIWAKVQAKINADNTPVRLALKSNKTARLFSILKYSAVAASIALLIGVGCFLLLNDEEIKAIFENFDYLNKNLYKTLKTDPLKVYGILLMMYLGIRPIETGQLMVNDLQETKDSEGNTIYYLSVSDENSSDNKFFNETKSQKTDNARRKLPLTDLLIKDFRFLAFVEKRKKDKHNFIFIDDENESTIINEIKNTVRRCEDTFNRYLKKLNLKDSNRKTFYSLRHSFANKIKCKRRFSLC
jgi:integrase